MVDQIHLALLWTTAVWFETKPLYQRGATPRKNNTGVRRPRGHAYANLKVRSHEPLDCRGVSPGSDMVRRSAP